MRNKHEVAVDPNTSPEILTILSTDRDWTVRFWVAGNPSTRPEILTALSQDAYDSVRLHVVENHGSPYGIWVPYYGRILP